MEQQPVGQPGQQVVEPGVGEVLFPAFAVGDVSNDPLDRDHGSRLVLRERQLLTHPDDGAVLAAHRDVDRFGQLACEEQRLHLVDVLRRDHPHRQEGVRV